MRNANLPGGPDAGAAVLADQSVSLIRYRAGVTGEAARTVHLVSLPDRCEAGVIGTWCGSLMSLDVTETVSPGEGMPCTGCIVNQVSARLDPTPVAESPVGGPEAGDEATPGGAVYHAWGWPVTQNRDQVWLSLHDAVSAIAVPITLSVELTRLLTARHCAPAVLAHPDAPEHRLVLAGERYGFPLPWPTGVYHVAGELMLPPTVTSGGQITWIQLPRRDSLRLSREIDVFGALRAAVKDAARGM